MGLLAELLAERETAFCLFTVKKAKQATGGDRQQGIYCQYSRREIGDIRRGEQKLQTATPMNDLSVKIQCKSLR